MFTNVFSILSNVHYFDQPIVVIHNEPRFDVDQSKFVKMMITFVNITVVIWEMWLTKLYLSF
jgi:hypothetical protein